MRALQGQKEEEELKEAKERKRMKEEIGNKKREIEVSKRKYEEMKMMFKRLYKSEEANM